jgi:hypothetical protein
MVSSTGTAGSTPIGIATSSRFRWDHRKVNDGERMVAAIRGAEGKRLMYG